MKAQQSCHDGANANTPIIFRLHLRSILFHFISASNYFEIMSAEDPEFSELKIPVPWGHIAGRTYGESSGFPVLLIHDWLDNSFVFSKLVPLLPDTFYIVAIDLPGHGKSSHFPKGIGYHLVDLVPALNRVVTHFNWARFFLLGHGTGAGVVILYDSVFSSKHKKQNYGLILLNSIKPPSVDVEGGAPILASAIDKLLDSDEIICDNNIAMSFEKCIKNVIMESESRHSEEDAEFLMKRGAVQDSEGNWLLTRDHRLNIPDTLRLTHDQCYDVLTRIETPILAITSPPKPELQPNQRYTIWKAEQIYKQFCKSFNHVEIEESHYLLINQPERIAETISKFLLNHSA